MRFSPEGRIGPRVIFQYIQNGESSDLGNAMEASHRIYSFNSSSSAFASFRSAVSKPSVNQL
jgi:hypothetical protein